MGAATVARILLQADCAGHLHRGSDDAASDASARASDRLGRVIVAHGVNHQRGPVFIYQRRRPVGRVVGRAVDSYARRVELRLQGSRFARVNVWKIAVVRPLGIEQTMLGARGVDVPHRRLEVRFASTDAMDVNRVFARRKAGKLQMDQNPARPLPERRFADNFTCRISELGGRRRLHFARYRRSRQQPHSDQHTDQLSEHYRSSVAIACGNLCT